MPSLLTNPIETGNTVAAINIVRKELTKILHVVNIVVQVLVLPYYIYLIYKNWSDVFYMVVYGLMLLVSVAAFIIELILDGRLKKKEDKAKKVAEKKAAAVEAVAEEAAAEEPAAEEAPAEA